MWLVKVGLVWGVWTAVMVGLAFLLPDDQPKFDAVGQIVILVLGVVAGILTHQILKERAG